MKVLVTAIGSMASDAVIRSLREGWQTAKIIGTDIHPGEWLFQSRFTDQFFRVPRSDHPDYLQKMSEICHEHKIDYVIPLIDPEVDFFAIKRAQFEEMGTKICISGTESIKQCRNKLVLYQLFKEDEDVSVIPTYTHLGNAEKYHSYPLIVKPRKGRSSEGIQILKERTEFGYSAFQTGLSIVQPYYGGDILTVDIIRDFLGNCISIPRKELIRSKIGAGLTVEIKGNKILEKLSEIVVEKLDITGAINIEFLYRDGKYYLMDINPRFSAGVSFTNQSGYDIVKSLMNIMMGNELYPKTDIQAGIYMKYYAEELRKKLT